MQVLQLLKKETLALYRDRMKAILPNFIAVAFSIGLGGHDRQPRDTTDHRGKSACEAGERGHRFRAEQGRIRPGPRSRLPEKADALKSGRVIRDAWQMRRFQTTAKNATSAAPMRWPIGAHPGTT